MVYSCPIAYIRIFIFLVFTGKCELIGKLKLGSDGERMDAWLKDT